MDRRLLIVLALLPAACRDVPTGFSGQDPFDSIPATETARLTWNAGGDHTPTWNATSDSVYYSAESYPGFPATNGLLLTVPRTQGSARLLFTALQTNPMSMPALMAPVVSPDRQSIAFVEVIEDDMEAMCPGGLICPVVDNQPDSTASNALLQRGTLRVRSLRNGAESQIPIVFDTAQDSLRLAYAFQRQYERSRALMFRPSWSSDGTRLVFSNGHRLFLWRVGDASATPIPNTQDGVWPAWRPNSDMIAFSRFRNEGSYRLTCLCNGGMSGARHHRTIIRDGRQRGADLFTINVDGTGLRALGEGEAPAWTPDGQTLVVHRADVLWRMSPDGTNASEIPNTSFAFEPSISHDARWIAFAKRREGTDPKAYDIWFAGF